MASITSALESANDFVLCVTTPELLDRDLKGSINEAVDFNRMVLSSYVGDWPMISFIVACDCKKTEGSQLMLDSLTMVRTSTPNRPRAVLY